MSLIHHVRFPFFVFGAWALLSLALHLVWEMGQLPLYTLWREAPPATIAWAVIHCTAGDGLLALSTFALACAWSRRLNWPWYALSRGLPVLLLSGVAYTAFSEWRNVYRLGSWAYREAMPTIFGIGVLPLVQWIVVPVIALWLLRSSTGFLAVAKARLRPRRSRL